MTGANTLNRRVVNFGVSAKRKAENLVAERSIPLRSERFFKLEDSWYFTTRENVTVGPFKSRDCARSAVNDFIDFIKAAPPQTVAAFTAVSAN